MTSTDPLADMVVARDGAIELLRAQAKEQAAEIERLRCAVITAKGMQRFWQVISEGKDAEIERLCARIAELEGCAVVTFGTLAQPTPDEPATITHNIPPNAPR